MPLRLDGVDAAARESTSREGAATVSRRRLRRQCPSGESWFELDVTKYLYAVTMGEAAKARVVRATPNGVPEMRQRQRRFLQTLRRRAGVAPSQICLAGFS